MAIYTTLRKKRGGRSLPKDILFVFLLRAEDVVHAEDTIVLVGSC